MKTAKFFSAGYNDGLAALLDTVIDNNPNANVCKLFLLFSIFLFNFSIYVNYFVVIYNKLFYVFNNFSTELSEFLLEGW